MRLTSERSLLVVMLVLLALGRTAPSAAGDSDCGTILTPQDARRELELGVAGAYRTRADATAIIFVPLTFHIVRTSTGEGGLPADRICEALDDLDGFFFDARIRFYLAGPLDFIDDDDFYFNINSMAEINALRNTNPVPGTINVYFTKNLDQGNGQFCGISSFTWSPVQGIVMDNDCTVVWWNHTTFPHEVGHYFDLLHTHETAHGAECVDGSNCVSAGDDLCDTPADPGLSSSNVDPNCVYSGNDTDPCNNDPYDPDPTNLESGSRPSCRTSFTPQQIEKARATLFNLRPELVHSGLPGPFDCNSNGVRDDCDIAHDTSEDTNASGIPDECECLSDVDADGHVGLSDLLLLLAQWGPCPGCETDVDNDGTVGILDLLTLLANWGLCP